MARGFGRRVWLECFFHRWSGRFSRGLLVVVGVIVLLPAPAPAQTGADREFPRTPWGTPDLQGKWTIKTMTPLERPEGYENTTHVVGDEADRFLKERQDDFKGFLDSFLSADFVFGRAGAADTFVVNPLVDGRTSLVVDPPDGRISRTTAGEERAAEEFGRSYIRAEGPEDRPLSERCLLLSSVPLEPGAEVTIFQTPEHVVIYQEFFHEAIIVPLDDRPSPPPAIRHLNGSSRGFWDGDTLVVDTTNFAAARSYQGSGAQLHLQQRFERLDHDTLSYAYTVEDPEAFTRPWSAAFPMTLLDEPIYEAACHEGNYTMPLLLSGARAEEEAAKLHGAFKLVSFDWHGPTNSAAFAEYSQGMLTYEEGGRMSVHLVAPARPNAAETASDGVRAVLDQRYFAYFGSYDVNVHKGIVRHHVEGGLSPSIVDQTLIRGFDFADDDKTLILTVTDGERVVGRVTWERYE